MSLIFFFFFYPLHAEKWRTLFINGEILINRRLQKVGITESDRLDGLVGTYVEINPVVVPRFNWIALDGSPEGDRVQGYTNPCVRVK